MAFPGKPVHPGYSYPVSVLSPTLRWILSGKAVAVYSRARWLARLSPAMLLIGIQRSVATAQTQGMNIPDVRLPGKANMIFLQLQNASFLILSGILSAAAWQKERSNR